jgi:hypothetical protein
MRIEDESSDEIYHLVDESGERIQRRKHDYRIGLYVELGKIYIQILDSTRPIMDNMKLAHRAEEIINKIKEMENEQGL